MFNPINWIKDNTVPKDDALEMGMTHIGRVYGFKVFMRDTGDGWDTLTIFQPLRHIQMAIAAVYTFVGVGVLNVMFMLNGDPSIRLEAPIKVIGPIK